MKIDELSELFNLKAQREELHERKMELRSIASTISSPRWDGLPKARDDRKSKTEKYAIEIADLDARIHDVDLKIIQAQKKNQHFISSIPDSRARLILGYRFYDCLSWEDVAQIMQVPGSTLKMYLSRYLRGLDSPLKKQ